MAGLWAAVPASSTRAAIPPASAPEGNHAPAIDAEQEANLLRVAGRGFEIYRTNHFIIAHNVDPALVQSLSMRLEQTYDSVTRFCRRTGFSLQPLARRLEVVFLDTWPDYQRFSRQSRFNCEGTYGFYLDVTNRSAFLNVENDPQLIKMQAGIKASQDNVSRMEDTLKSIRGNQPLEIVYADGRREQMTKAQAKDHCASAHRELEVLEAQRQNYCDRINCMVVQHEVAHQVLYNTGAHVRGAMNPRWLVEGLACIFETPPTSMGSGLGAINQARLKDFRRMVAGDGDSQSRALTSSMYADAVAQRRMTSLKELVRNGDLFNERGDRGSAHYAVAWALVHYLQRMQGKALASYLREVGERQPGVDVSADEEMQLFEKHFGPIDAGFLSRFSGYILQLPCRGMPGEPN